jgi:hypothetical protein
VWRSSICDRSKKKTNVKSAEGLVFVTMVRKPMQCGGLAFVTMDEKRKCKKKCGGLVSVAMEDLRIQL